jgi:hypothetical protein
VGEIIDQFPALFSQGKSDLGRVPLETQICHRIVLKPEALTPIRHRSISMYCDREQDFIATEVEMLRSMGIITTGLSPWIFASVSLIAMDR